MASRLLQQISNNYNALSWKKLTTSPQPFAAVFQSLFQYSPFSTEFLILHRPQLVVSCPHTQDLQREQLLRSPAQPQPQLFQQKRKLSNNRRKLIECECSNALSNWIHSRKPQNKSGLAILKTKHKIHAFNSASSWSAIHPNQIHTSREIIDI